jgi:hypothetical protein
MRTRNIAQLAAVALIVGGPIACNRSGDGHGRSPESMSSSSISDRDDNNGAAVTTGHSSVVDGIARARCEREQRCGNVGPGRKWPALEDCTRQITSDWRDELNAFECTGGIVEEELDECMGEIRNEDCASPLDTLGRIVACRASDICRATVR